MHPMLNTAVKAARKAGSLITRASFDLDKLTIRAKRQKDYVSEVDHAAEDAILAVLRDAYPDHGVLAEESGRGEKKSDYVWVIDPLDGTTNFLHGNPQYCVSIGLLVKGVPTQAVVLDPNRNELFTATKGVGAYLNDRRIRVSRRDKLEQALVGTGFPFKEVGNLDDYMRMLKNVMLATSGVRRPGAAALDLAWVAAGR
ncbi:MAG TPA: inositol monophosphatase family protein, partial [Usitatibacter sp.]|nr:inositol monophosphatase family protein [Usitatibacter sp.]